MLHYKNSKDKENNDRTVTIKMHADGVKKMSCYLFQWSDKIKPIAPAEPVSAYDIFI